MSSESVLVAINETFAVYYSASLANLLKTKEIFYLISATRAAD